MEKPRGPVPRSDPTAPRDCLTRLRVCKLGKRQPAVTDHAKNNWKPCLCPNMATALHLSSSDLIITSRGGFSRIPFPTQGIYLKSLLWVSDEQGQRFKLKNLAPVYVPRQSGPPAAHRPDLTPLLPVAHRLRMVLPFLNGC